jgi:DNA topoisomerase-3
VKVSKDACECGAMLLEVDFNRNDTPLPGNETFHKGCVFCDDVLSALVQEGCDR